MKNPEIQAKMSCCICWVIREGGHSRHENTMYFCDNRLSPSQVTHQTTIHMVDSLRIHTHNSIRSLQTIKTAVKLVSMVITTMEVAITLYRTLSNFDAPSSRLESTQPDMESGELIQRSTQMRRRRRRVDH